jgi:hypothetical protein
MRAKNIVAVGAAGIVAALLLVVGCDDPGVTAPSDGTILITANPGTVIINQDEGEESGQTSILAQVYDASNYPVQDANVIFVTTGGTMASAGEPGSDPQALVTDINGVVTDTLTLTVADDNSVTVSAKSGTLISDVVVTKTLNTGDIAPVAVADVDPPIEQTQGAEVAFIGSGSFDADGEIWCYQWEVTNNDPLLPPVIFFNDTATTEIYTLGATQTQKFVNAILRVSDDPDLAAECGSRDPVLDPSRFRGTASVTNYRIACDTAGPNAVISGSNPRTARLAPDSATNDCPDGVASCAIVELRGDASTSTSGIQSYEWDCGNGTSQSGPIVECIYNTIDEFDVTLTVQNNCNQVDNAAIKVNVLAQL